MIPAHQLHPRATSELYDYLRTEIFQAQGERAPLEERWIKFIRAYRAQPAQDVKEFPFLGAANLVIPVVATDVDTIYSRIMGLLFGPENLWSTRALRPDMIEYGRRLQEFLQWAQDSEIGAYDAVADWVLEMTKLGTGILKQRYKRDVRQVYQFRESDFGTMEKVLTVMLKDHPVLEHVSLFDFLVPSIATDIQSSPWVAERVGVTWPQLVERIKQGVYTGGDRMASWWATDRGSPVLQEYQRLDRYVPGMGNRIDLWEAWLDWDVSGTGMRQAVVCTLHMPSQTVLRIDYNPFFNQEKPYSSARFLRQEKRFYGIGLAEMLDMFQEEASTTHNQRLDNKTLANSSMFKGRKGVVREDEPIFPGRWFILDNLEDVQPMPMGQRFDSTVQDEQMMLGYASKRTGVNDYIQGSFEPAMGYSTATVGVQQLREAAKRFDQTMREIRVAIGESGTRIVELYQQFNQNGKEYLVLGDEDGQALHQVLQFPIELIRKGIGIETTATSAALNKEVDIRVNTIIMQMLTQFYQQMFQGVGLMLNEQVPPPLRMLAGQMVEGGSILMRRILDGYGVQDANRLVPKLNEVLNGGAGPTGAPAIGGGGIPNQGPPPAPGMAPGPQGIGGAQGFNPQPPMLGAGLQGNF